MRQYREKKKREKAIIKIQNAIRNKRAIQEVARRYVDRHLNNPNQFFNKNATTIQNAIRNRLSRKRLQD